MAVKSNISKIVASQMGPLQGKLRSEVQKKVLELLAEFSNGCPNQAKMKEIILVKNNLLKIINSFKKRVDSIKTLSGTIKPSISVANTALNVIVSLPTPTAIIPPQTGGLGVPMSVLNAYSKGINTLMQTIDVLESDVEAVDSIVTAINTPLNSLITTLSLLDSKILICSLNSNADLSTILNEVQPPSNTGSEGIPSADFTYKGYVLEIVQDSNSPKIAPKRYAIATDSRGIVVLQGDSSFSSSTQVLLDEIKFRIDNKIS